MEYRDYYQILGVAKDADEKSIKSAYRQLARKYHPDKNPENKKAEEKFKEINEAYEVLGNSDNRAKYDQLGSNYHRYQQMGGNPADYDFSQWFGGGAGAGRRSGTRGGYQQVDLGDLFGNGGFSDFFTSMFGQQGAGNMRGQQDMFRQSGTSANLDISETVKITLEEAFSGTTRTYSRNGEQFTAKIPAGAKTGTKIRLRGKGNQGAYGTGDLFLVMEVLSHDTFKRAGHNLQVEIGIDVLTAVLGGKAKVPTLTGPGNLTIPPGTQGGQTFRLKGKGMPHLREPNQFGDLLVTLRINIPQDLTEEERQLYEQLGKLEKKAPA